MLRTLYISYYTHLSQKVKSVLHFLKINFSWGMNKSTSFQPVSGVVLSGILPRCFPAFLTVWGGQTERERPFSMSNSMQSVFRVSVGLLADCRITAAVCKQTLFQGGVVGADMDKGVFLVNQISVVFSCLVSLFSCKLRSTPLLRNRGIFSGVFSGS